MKFQRETEKMRLGIASWSFILLLLFVINVQESGARKIGSIITVPAEKDTEQVLKDGLLLLNNNIMEEIESGDIEKMKMNKSNKLVDEDMDPELNVFFIPSDLKVGKKMPIYFSQKDSATSPKFIPKEEANKIPFTPEKLPYLLEFFSISKESPQAKAMEYTLEQCNFEPMEGETKFCATSLESLFDFAHYLFGNKSRLKVLTTKTKTKSSSSSSSSSRPVVLLQNYTISKVDEISVPNVIGCHPMPYPFAVFYCHSQKGDTSLYEVVVEGENGDRVESAAICHMDTSKWDADHVAFRVLRLKPGTSPVCHFFPPDNLVWVPLIA